MRPLWPNNGQNGHLHWRMGNQCKRISVVEFVERCLSNANFNGSPVTIEWQFLSYSLSVSSLISAFCVFEFTQSVVRIGRFIPLSLSLSLTSTGFVETLFEIVFMVRERERARAYTLAHDMITLFRNIPNQRPTTTQFQGQ